MARQPFFKGGPLLLAAWMLGHCPWGVTAPVESASSEASAKTEKTEGAPTKASTAEGAVTPAVDTTPPAPIRNPPLRLEIRRNQPLAKQIEGMEGAQGNALWLGDEKDPFLGLYIEAYAGKPMGAVLLLHDNEQHPDWPGVLRELRLSFPKHGWSSMSIALPDFRPIPPILPPLPKPEPLTPAPAAPTGEANTEVAENGAEAPAKDEKADKDKGNAGKDTASGGKDDKEKPAADAKQGDTAADNAPPEGSPPPATAAPATPPLPEFLQRDSEIPVEKYPEEVERRIKEATRYLINEGVQHVVIIAFGNSAGLAAHISRKMLINELDGLVLMDPKPYPEARFDLPKDTADLRIPVLDVVPQYEPATNPLLRKQATGRMQTPHYEMRLVRGAAVSFSGYEPYVFKAVRGWADTQFRNAPTRKDRTMQAQKKRAEKAATPISAPPAAATPPAVTTPPPKGTAPNLNEAIPPPIP